MARPTFEDAERLRAEIKNLADQGMTVSEIAKTSGKSRQAVHEFMTRHRIKLKESEAPEQQ